MEDVAAEDVSSPLSTPAWLCERRGRQDHRGVVGSSARRPSLRRKQDPNLDQLNPGADHETAERSRSAF